LIYREVRVIGVKTYLSSYTLFLLKHTIMRADLQVTANYPQTTAATMKTAVLALSGFQQHPAQPYALRFAVQLPCFARFRACSHATSQTK